MLARANRLTATRSIERLYKKGVCLSRPTLTFFFLASRPHLPARLAVVIGKKVSPKAVQRNRLKRIVRSELAALLSTLPSGYDYLVALRSPAAYSEATLRAELAAASAEARRRTERIR